MTEASAPESAVPETVTEPVKEPVTEPETPTEAKGAEVEKVAEEAEEAKEAEGTAATPETLDNIAERLTFFFSNANVRADRFMQKTIMREDKEDFGGVMPVETLLKFKSIQQYTTDPAHIVEAAKTKCDFLVLSDAGDGISVKDPMTKAQLDDNIPLSLHVDGLPVANDRYLVTVADLTPLFSEHGRVALVKLKWKPAAVPSARNEKKRFVPAGSCLVEYENAKDAESAAAALVGEDKKKELTVKGSNLTITKLADWIAGRKAQKEARKESGGGNKKDEKRSSASSDNKKRKDAPAPVKEFALDWKKGCVVSLSGLDKDACDREAICAAAAAFQGVYADYSRGQSEGAIRFSEPSDDIAAFCEKLKKGEAEIAGKKVADARILEGEEEEAYWKKFIDFKNEQIRSKASSKSNKRRRR